MKRFAVSCVAVAVLLATTQEPKPPAPPLRAVGNPQIDFPGFLDLANAAAAVREPRRLTEVEFAAAIGQPGTVLLDARSADKYRARHIAGAVSLPFTDFTAAALANVIPTGHTRVLIYCNNNFGGDERAFASKAPRASLNISTYIALATYGYTNVWELGPKLDVQATRLRWAGTDTGR